VSRKAKKIAILLFAVLCVVGVGFFAAHYLCGIRVVLLNVQRDADIDSIILRYAGGQTRCAKLPGGETASFFISPNGESSIVAEWKCDGRAFSKDVNLYIEPGYIETIYIAFCNGDAMTAERTIYP